MRLGIWAVGRLAGWKSGRLGNYGTGRLGGWKAGRCIREATRKEFQQQKKTRKVVDRGVVMPPWAVKVGSMWRGSGYRMCKKPAVFVHSIPETCKTNGRGSRNAPLGGQSGVYVEGECI